MASGISIAMEYHGKYTKKLVTKVRDMMICSLMVSILFIPVVVISSGREQKITEYL